MKRPRLRREDVVLVSSAFQWRRCSRHVFKLWSCRAMQEAGVCALDSDLFAVNDNAHSYACVRVVT